MLSKKLQTHISLSKTAAEANKAKGNRHVEILSSLYSDTSRFIEELLQNASDACQRKGMDNSDGKVRFLLKDSVLYMYHNGILFDEDDLISITTIGQSTKPGLSDVNLIGKFGLGFKSVFAVCDEPQIHSGNFHFRITDFEVLEEIPGVGTEGYGTCIILPLKQDKQIIRTVEQGLNKLTYRHLLFVGGYGEISVESNLGRFVLKTETIRTFDTNTKIINIHDSRKQDLGQFLIFAEEDGFISLAFRICSDSNFSEARYSALAGEKAFVYFPTLTDTGLDFMIHAAFTTTPTREQIPFDPLKSPENLKMLDRIKAIFSKMPVRLKKFGLLHESFWTVVPVFRVKPNDDLNPILKAVISGLLASIEKDVVLPATNGKFHRIDGMICADSSLAELLLSGDVQLLFHRKAILSVEIFRITEKQLFTRAPYSKIKQVDAHDFAYAIAGKPTFLERKNVQWHLKFLKFVAANTDLWNRQKRDSWFSLREKPFILLNDMSIAAPHAGQNVQFYLYDKRRRNIPMVHRLLAQDEDLMSFLKMLEIPSPDDLHEFKKNILSVFEDTHLSVRKGLNAWTRFFEAYSLASDELKIQYAEAMQNVRCIPAKFSLSREKCFMKPSETYMEVQNVHVFFRGTDIPLADHRLTELAGQSGIQNPNVFFQKMGVHVLPAYIPIVIKSRDAEFDDFRKQIEERGLKIVKETFTDFDIHGLDQFLDKPTPDQSVVLASLLIQNVPSATLVFETYTQTISKEIEPAFIRKLRTRPWLFNPEGKAQTVSEVSSLHSHYSESGIHINELKRRFGLSVSFTEVSDEELKLILKLRASGHDTAVISEALENTVFSIPENIPEISVTNPVLIDLNSSAGHSESGFESKPVTDIPGFDQFVKAHIHENFSHLHRFNELPEQKRARMLVLNILNNKFGSEQVIENNDDVDFKAFEIRQDNKTVFHVYVSGIRTNNGMFLFPDIRNVHTDEQIPLLLFAVDRVFHNNPVVYMRELKSTAQLNFLFGATFLF